MFDPAQPPLVSETLLKKRRSLDELAHRRAVTLGTQNKVWRLLMQFNDIYNIIIINFVQRKRVVRGENIKIKRPEQFLKENEIVSLSSCVLFYSLSLMTVSYHLQRKGSRNKMQRRERQEARRSHCSVPAGEMRDTCGFVVRIHIGRHASDEIKTALREMKLNKKYDAKIIRLDEETIGMF